MSAQLDFTAEEIQSPFDANQGVARQRIHLVPRVETQSYQNVTVEVVTDTEQLISIRQRMIFNQRIGHLLARCCSEHPHISIEPEVLGGIPHIRDSRVSVAYVLDQLYVLGSIGAVADLFAPEINEKQVKDAVGFAQLFVELACDPDQTND